MCFSSLLFFNLLLFSLPRKYFLSGVRCYSFFFSYFALPLFYLSSLLFFPVFTFDSSFYLFPSFYFHVAFFLPLFIGLLDDSFSVILSGFFSIFSLLSIFLSSFPSFIGKAQAKNSILSIFSPFFFLSFITRKSRCVVPFQSLTLGKVDWLRWRPFVLRYLEIHLETHERSISEKSGPRGEKISNPRLDSKHITDRQIDR